MIRRVQPTHPLIPAASLAPGGKKPPGVCRSLLTSDWHGDKSTAGFARFDDVTGSARRAGALAVELECDWFGFLGDLTDPEAGAHRCVQFAIEQADWLRARGVGSFWLGGNHDAVEDAAGSSTLDPLAAYAVSLMTLRRPSGPPVFVFTEPGTIRLALGVQLVALPHPHRGRPYVPAEQVELLGRSSVMQGERVASVLVAGHLEVDAYERPELRGSETLDMPRGRLGRFPVAACSKLWGERAVLANGHYHRSHGAKDQVLVPGSIERLSRAEATHLPRVMVLDLPLGAAS